MDNKTLTPQQKLFIKAYEHAYDQCDGKTCGNDEYLSLDYLNNTIMPETLAAARRAAALGHNPAFIVFDAGVHLGMALARLIDRTGPDQGMVDVAHQKVGNA